MKRKKGVKEKEKWKNNKNSKIYNNNNRMISNNKYMSVNVIVVIFYKIVLWKGNRLMINS